MPYHEQLNKHLVAYKRDVLGLTEPGVFRYRGRDVLVDHILRVDSSWLNLVEPSRTMVQKYCKAHPGFRRHRYFHHLNSSQAFALNLFFPFFEGGSPSASALLRALGQGRALLNWEPEAMPDEREGTNIDATWDTTDQCRTICEVKLSERDFGKARHDARHLWKLRTIYKPVLRAHVDPALLRPEEFFKSYQILRNVWHMVQVESGQLLFLLPRENRKLWPLLDATLGRVQLKTRKRIRALAIEDVLDALCRDVECPADLRAYSVALRRKYVPGQESGRRDP
jgi:hypothetical protein